MQDNSLAWLPVDCVSLCSVVSLMDDYVAMLLPFNSPSLTTLPLSHIYMHTHTHMTCQVYNLVGGIGQYEHEVDSSVRKS